MRLYVLILMLFLSSEGHAYYGNFSGETCPYRPQQYQPPQSDYTHAAQVQARELEQRRLQLELQLNQVSRELLLAQNHARRYFRNPWAETILAHMDNGFDCCSQRTYSQLFEEKSRMPAGDPSYVPPAHQDTEVVTPAAPYQEEEPPPPPPRPVRPVAVTPPVPPPAPIHEPQYQPARPHADSCYGQDPQYCQNDWGHETHPETGGQHCLQTGFAATPAWYHMACRPGGQIDPRVCSDRRVTTSPHEQQACFQMLQVYQQLSLRKRHLASQIAGLRSQIQIYSQPNRPHAPHYGTLGHDTESQYGAHGSTEAVSGSGLLSVLGAVLGGFASSYANNQIYQPQPHYRPFPGPSLPSRPIPGGPIPGRLPGRVIGVRPISPSPVPYYGPNYGYPYSNAGRYGAIVPGTTGAFGCSTGNNTGFSLIGQLLGQFLLRNNNRGPFVGYRPYAQFNSLYGNRLPGQPIQSFRGVPPPYRPGGIYPGIGPAVPGGVITPRQYISQPTVFGPGYNQWNNSASFLRPQAPNFFNSQYAYQPQQQVYRPSVPGRVVGVTPIYSAAPQIYRQDYYQPQNSGGLAGVLSAMFGGTAGSSNIYMNFDF